jgi:DNA-binding CsgD family transcriptional regulator/tetratricopeptide (TPR) repeat protein
VVDHCDITQPDVASSRSASVLVGRTRELAALRAELTAAMAGHGRVVLLSGEAGIGKSTLAKDFAADAEGRGATVSIGRCYEGGGMPAFAPWQGLLADLPPAAAEANPLPPPFGTGEPAQTTYQLMTRVATHLDAVAASRPLVLFLDDLHWADRDTLELLDVVTRSKPRVPLLVLATYRPESLHRSLPLFDILPGLQRDRPITFVELGGLSVADTLQLVEASHGPCSPDLSAYLHMRSDGHPLFLVELLRDLSERRLLPRDAAGRLLPPSQPVSVPGRLQHLIAHRVARLGIEEETLLTVASVVGEEWNLGVVEAVLDWDEEPLLRALEGALDADIIVPVGEGERYRFRHGMIREVLYGEQLARRRKRLHERVAVALEHAAPTMSHDRASTLAYHFTAAEDWEKAVHYGIAAGDAAREQFAGHGALLAYQQALATLGHAPPATVRAVQAGLLERLGQAQLLIGQPEAADAAFGQMLEAAQAVGDRAAEGRALVWTSYVRRRQYQPAGSDRAGEVGLRVAEEVGEPRLLALAHWNLGHLYEIEGRLDASAHHATEAERLARLAAEPDILSRSLLVQALLAVWRGLYVEGERLASEAVVLARGGHDGLAFVAAHWRLGLALGELGQYAAARRVLLNGVTHAETLGERYYLSKLLNSVGWLYNELGDPETARSWNLRALESVRGSHRERVTEAERYTLLNLATDELNAGNIDAAAAHLHAFEPLLEQHEYGLIRYLTRYHLVRGELALAQGDPVSTLDDAAEAACLATETGMRKNLAKSWLLAGRARLMQGRGREAIESLAEGVTLADEIAHGSLRWQGRLWLGQAMRAVGRDAADIFREAMAQVGSLARDLDDDIVRATFLSSKRVVELRDSLAAAEVQRPEERSAGLTARELDVLRLLVRHQTDKEIAAALFLSPRTVNTHVANILIKLNVANRREAAAAAAGLGLD